MNKYEKIKNDMKESLRTGNKLRRTVLADMVAAIEKAAVAGKKRVEITDKLVDEVLLKYKKTTQEMVDTCPDTEQYAERKAEYKFYMTVVEEYAPQIISDENEIADMIKGICGEKGLKLESSYKPSIMKAVMPMLKNFNCDMRVAQTVLASLIV